jgi:hypothetical protein
MTRPRIFFVFVPASIFQAIPNGPRRNHEALRPIRAWQYERPRGCRYRSSALEKKSVPLLIEMAPTRKPPRGALSTRFLKRFRSLHRSEWEELMSQERWANGTPSTTPRHSGIRCRVDTERCTMRVWPFLALHARLAVAVTIVALGSWAVFAVVTHAAPSLHCLPGWVS